MIHCPLKLFTQTALGVIWLAALAMLAPARAAAETPPPPHPALHLVGDSTMANHPTIPPNPMRGWGQVFPSLFSEPNRVINHAANARSTKSYLEERRWEKVLSQLQPGDFVLIQFGHNDEKKRDEKRYTDPHADFPANLRRFVREARDKGASVLLATPVNRHGFDQQGHFEDSHGDYPDAVRKIAEEEKVPLIDLHRATRVLLEKLGPEESKKLFIFVKPGEYTRFPEGMIDDSHFSKEGAMAVAQIVAEEIRTLKHPLATWLK